jgi:TseV toxin immunity protein TsiV
MDRSKFTLREGDRTVASLCVEVVAFSYSTPAATARGFDHALHTFAKYYGKQLKFYKTGDMKSYREVDNRTLDIPYHWFSSEKDIATKMLAFFAHSGDTNKSIETPGPDLTLWGFHKPSFHVFRAALPVGLADHPDEIVAFVREALQEFPLTTGYCGYSYFCDFTLDRRKVEPWAGPLLLRHPGLNYGNKMPFTNVADKGVAVVSWLTLLGRETSDDLGGLAALEAAVPDTVSIVPIDTGGVLLRAGDVPQLGDVNRHDLLPLYHAVGQIVSPRRVSDDDFDKLVAIRGIPKEARVDWLRRFFV